MFNNGNNAMHLHCSPLKVNDDNDENSEDDPFVFRARNEGEGSEDSGVGEQPDRYGKLPDYDDMSDLSDDEIGTFFGMLEIQPLTPLDIDQL